MTALTFTPATKKALKARIAIEGPSGSGKTYTALVTAQALGKRIAVIDTERRSASLYADRFTFDALELDRFAPELLIEALAAAAAGGYDVVVIDSWSHFWMGADGMLEAVDKAAKRSGGGNNFAGWKEMRPTERKMVDAMLAFPGHLIATLRVKTEYVVETNDRGKAAPKKVGLKAEQREGLEYEFTVVASMDLENTLVVSKSRCPALSGAVITKPTAEFGRTLLGWLDDGASAGESAAALRDELLANPNATLDEIRSVRERGKAAGLLGTALVDEHGDATTLDEWLIARGHAAQGAARPAAATPPPAAPAAPTPQPAAAAAEPEKVSQAQHRRMHALWRDLGYDGEHNRDNRLDITGRILGRAVDTSSDLTVEEASEVIDALEARKKAQRADAAEQPVPSKPAQPAADGRMTAAQRRELFAELQRLGLDSPVAGLQAVNDAIAPAVVASTKELTEFQAAQAIGALKGLVPAS